MNAALDEREYPCAACSRDRAPAHTDRRSVVRRVRRRAPGSATSTQQEIAAVMAELAPMIERERYAT